MAIDRAAIVDRKLEELHIHRSRALDYVDRAFETANSSLFGEAVRIFEASEPALEGLVAAKGDSSLTLKSLAELVGKVELIRQEVALPYPAASNN